MVRNWKQWEGEVIDGCFPLQRYLGGSGHSAVFLTQHDEPPLKAAIKLVPEDSADAGLLSCWERAAELSHPHLIRLFRTGSCRLGDASLFYAVMEYAEEDIALVLGERTLTTAETAEMLEPVVQALAYIHGLGLAHGHLKPGNIMAVGDQLKISSDGVRPAGELGGHAMSPSPYDPPELQVAGPSRAGDIWSLGMVLVEALTRQLPRPEGPGGEMEMPDSLPAIFLVAARGCLQADPKRRAPLEYITARLERASSPPAAPGPSPPPEAIRPLPPAETPVKRRYPVVVAGIGVALVAGLAVARLLHHPEPSAASPAPPLVANTRPSPVPVPAALPAEPKPSPTSAVSRPPAPPPAEPPAKESAASASGDVVHRVLPEVLPAARMSISGRVKVTVRASVDGSGKVTTARLESPGPSKYFSRVSVQAADHWRFRPPKVQGRDVPSEWLLLFEFTPKGTEVSPRRISP